MKTLALIFALFLLNLNHSFSQAIIHIWGTEDSDEIKQQVKSYLEILEINENINLLVGFTKDISDELNGYTFLSINESHPYPTIRVNLSSELSHYTRDLVLAHEMIHVKQIVKGELKLTQGTDIIWKEQTYIARQQLNYYALPWEREAFVYDKILVHALEAQRDVLFIE